MFSKKYPPPGNLISGATPGIFFYENYYLSRRKIEKGGILLYILMKITIFQGEKLKKGGI